MKVFAIPATNVNIKLLKNQVSGNIKNINMKVFATLVISVIIKQQPQVIFRDILAQFISISYPCGQCDYIATFAGALKTHIESVHEGVRYSCRQCDYKATFAGALNRHVESIHEGVRFPCDQCDYKATQKTDLKRHRKSKH